jgi:hypothetical protein
VVTAKNIVNEQTELGLQTHLHHVKLIVDLKLLKLNDFHFFLFSIAPRYPAGATSYQ